jgi:hypothetical protein
MKLANDRQSAAARAGFALRLETTPSHSAKQSVPQQQNARQFETNTRATPITKKRRFGSPLAG